MAKDHNKAVMEKEQVRSAVREIWPLVEEVSDKARKLGVEGYVRVTSGDDGYLSLELGNTEWEVVRYSKGEKPVMRFEWKEQIFNDPGENTEVQ